MDVAATWDDERYERNAPSSFSSPASQVRMGSARHKDGGDASESSLPAIATSQVVVPTPTPPLAAKSKLKPPSQRTVLLSSLGVGTGSASSLKLPMLVKPTVATAKPVEVIQNNQEYEQQHEPHADGSGRSLLSSGPRGSVVDKYRDYIKDLEEQKRKEKEAQAKQDARRRKLQKKLTEKILQEAALARHKQSEEPTTAEPETSTPEESPESADCNEVDDEAKRQQEKEAKRQRKRLLKKQQALLEALQAKKREKEEEEQQEKQRERRREKKLKKAVLDAIHATRLDDDAGKQEEPGAFGHGDDKTLPQGQDISSAKNVPEESDHVMDEEVVDVDNQSIDVDTQKVRRQEFVKEKKTKKKHKKQHSLARATAESPDTVAAVETDSMRQRTREGRAPSITTGDSEPLHDQPPKLAKEKSDAVQKKQQDYLVKLAEQRRLKQKEDEDAKLAQEKRRKRVQLEAQQRLQEAAAKLQQQRLLDEQTAAEQDHEDDKKVVVDVSAMVARLSKLKEKDAQVIPEARDFASWKKRHGVRSDQKVFSMTGWYPVIRTALEARGWFCNEERGSPFFDLKWSLKSDDLKNTKLKEDQYVNHFFSNTAITTKVGLLHTLRNLPWHHSVDVDTVFPRAYDLNEPRDMDAFIMDFRYTFAEGVLKQVAQRIAETDGQSVRLNEAVVAVLLSIGGKKLRAKRALGLSESPESLEESVDDALGGGVDDPVSDLEWEVLSRHQLDMPGKFRASLAYKKKIVIDAERDPTTVPGEAAPVPSTAAVDTVLSALEKKQQRQLERLRVEAFDREKTLLAAKLARVSVLATSTREELRQLVQHLGEASPQFALNGSPSRNVWIVKPAGLSRGRGIRVFNDLSALLAYADVENHKECQWVAQKYIENPLLLCDRKFDIRQWVLVTSWDPLTVWVYDDFYLRFSSEPYSTEDLSDQYVHLTNNSIQKYSDKFSDVYATADGELRVEGNMLHSDAFRRFLQRTRGLDDAALERTLHGRMKEMIVQSLQCAQDLVQHRKNACELYGYDFMVDETLRPWLIEVNSSPACDYSTPTAQRYVETGLDGIVRVIVDHREYEARKKNGAVEPEPSTGKWRRVHKGEYIGKPVAAFGADFQLKGSKVQRPRGRVTAKVVASRDPVAKRPEDLHPETVEEEDGEEEGVNEEEEETKEEAEERCEGEDPLEEEAEGGASVDSLL